MHSRLGDHPHSCMHRIKPVFVQSAFLADTVIKCRSKRGTALAEACSAFRNFMQTFHLALESCVMLKVSKTTRAYQMNSMQTEALRQATAVPDPDHAMCSRQFKSTVT